jgi:hypothetical protein
MFNTNSSLDILTVKNAILRIEDSIFHIFMYEIPILILPNPQCKPTSFINQHPWL